MIAQCNRPTRVAFKHRLDTNRKLDETSTATTADGNGDSNGNGNVVAGGLMETWLTSMLDYWPILEASYIQREREKEIAREYHRQWQHHHSHSTLQPPNARAQIYASASSQWSLHDNSGDYGPLTIRIDNKDVTIHDLPSPDGHNNNGDIYARYRIEPSLTTVLPSHLRDTHASYQWPPTLSERETYHMNQCTLFGKDTPLPQWPHLQPTNSSSNNTSVSTETKETSSTSRVAIPISSMSDRDPSYLDASWGAINDNSNDDDDDDEEHGYGNDSNAQHHHRNQIVVQVWVH
jgi:hypothetical protein